MEKNLKHVCAEAVVDTKKIDSCIDQSNFSKQFRSDLPTGDFGKNETVEQTYKRYCENKFGHPDQVNNLISCLEITGNSINNTQCMQMQAA